MEHWFDAFTRALAWDRVNRRDVIKAALAGVGVAPFLLEGEASKASAGAATTGPATANPAIIRLPLRTQTSGGGGRTTTMSGSGTYKGQALTLRVVRNAVGGRFPEVTIYQRVDLGSNLLYESSTHFVPGFLQPSGRGTKRSMVPVGSAEIRYGLAIRSPRNVVLKGYGGAVQGFVDGRAVSNQQGGAVTVEIDPELQRAVEELAASSRGNSGRSPGPMRTLDLPTGPCWDCHNNCEKQYAECGAAAYAAIAGGPWAYFAALAACVKNESDCEDNCNREGGPCCALQCGNNDFCCETGQFCCGQPGDPNGGCCNSGEVCTSGKSYWGDTVSWCCPAGSDPNGCNSFNRTYEANFCHKPGEACCGLRACSTGEFCADARYDLCCSNGQVLCNDLCCSGECFTYNKGMNSEFQVCCPTQSVCGGTCCAPNEKCLTSSTGVKVCCDHPLCGEECCAPGEICSNGHCGWGTPCGNGPPCGFAVCCNGVCCEFNQTCVNGKCTTGTCPPGEVPCPVTPNHCCPPKFQCCVNGTCCDPSKTECCGGRGCVPIGTCVQ